MEKVYLVKVDSLHDGKIDVLQNYYGIAIRENLNYVQKWPRM